MGKVWEKLDRLDNLYSEVFKKAGSIKGEMICMGLFTGVDTPGERHPFQCPCSEKERIRKEQEETDRIQEENRRLQEKIRQERTAERERILDIKKKMYYRNLKSKLNQKPSPRGDKKKMNQKF